MPGGTGAPCAGQRVGEQSGRAASRVHRTRRNRVAAITGADSGG
jgi:hypothetical protein